MKDELYAFPVGVPSGEGNASHLNEGMTLRDYFAAKAMQGWLSTFHDSRHPTENGCLDNFAIAAYKIADAMLKARGES